MRILVYSYDLSTTSGSAESLRAAASYWTAQGDTVWVPQGPLTLDEVRAWNPDLLVSQQWAVQVTANWARECRKPFVLFVHGPGQFEHFMPLCDLVVFSTSRQQSLASAALGPRVESLVAGDALELHARLTAIAERGRRAPTLALCMTVSNEAATLRRAVESVREYADEIVIGVDTRSVDATAEIAKELADQYFEYTESSPPDFRRMRNRALERSTCDWALVLDGHEWVGHADRIRPLLDSDAWSIEVRTLFEPDENGVPSLSFLFPRIHRRHIRFEGAAVHEEVSTPLDRRVTAPYIHFWHERKPGAAARARTEEKQGSELDVLRSAWTNGGDRRALFYLANGLRERGEFAEAATAYREYLECPNFDEEAWQARLYLGRCYRGLGDAQSARRVLEEAALGHPERAETFAELGGLYLEAGEPRPAAAWSRIAASLPEPDSARLFIETPVYRWGAWHQLALALNQLEDYAGAAEAEERAEAGGAGPWARANIRRWKQLEGSNS